MTEDESLKKELEDAIEDEIQNQDTDMYQLTPAKMMEVFPLSYELFSVIQHACSHF
jgi:hypothetical protein